MMFWVGNRHVSKSSPPSWRAVGRGTAPDLRRPSQWWKAPPPGTPFRHPHSEQRRTARAHAVGPVLGPHARTDRTQDTRVAEPRLPAPEDGRPGQGQRLTPDAPHNGGRPPPPPGDGAPPPPRHAAPTGHAGQGDSVGPPHPHTRAHSTWVADPYSPPSGRAVGGGGAPDLRRPSQWWKAAPPGTPFHQPHSEQRRPARAHAVGPVLGPHARNDRTRDTRVAEPWLPAPEDGWPGEGQRLTTDAPHNSGRPPPPRGGPQPPPRHAAPTGHAGQGDSVGPPHPHTGAQGTWVADPNSPPSARAVGGGTARDLRRPSQWWKAPPPGDALPPPPQRATPASKGARCGAGAWSPRPHRPHPGHTGRGTLAARSRGRAAGGGTASDTRRPSQRRQATPPGTTPHHPRGTQPPQGMQVKGTVLGPHTHTPAPTARGWRTQTARPVGGQSWEGQRLTSDAPHNGGRHPPGDALPPARQRATLARKGACCGAGAGSPRPHRPHPGHTGRGTLAARSRGRAAGGGTAPDTRRPSQRWQATPPRGRPPTTLTARSPHRVCRPRGQCWAPTPTHPRPQHVGGGPRQPAQWAGSRGRDSA